mmetsp:Transcript_23787/g.59695  ORF Transcript_23787/g.59695 Transcript_23787/m.59695 type:complete len:229 (-) Transcript_23787:521-1207(-)
MRCCGRWAGGLTARTSDWWRTAGCGSCASRRGCKTPLGVRRSLWNARGVMAATTRLCGSCGERRMMAKSTSRSSSSSMESLLGTRMGTCMTRRAVGRGTTRVTLATSQEPPTATRSFATSPRRHGPPMREQSSPRGCDTGGPSFQQHAPPRIPAPARGRLLMPTTRRARSSSRRSATSTPAEPMFCGRLLQSSFQRLPPSGTHYAFGRWEGMDKGRGLASRTRPITRP